MKMILYVFISFLIGCQANPTPEQSTLAFINDTSIYADGCELFIDTGLDSVRHTYIAQFKPSEKTVFTVKRAQLLLSPGQPIPDRLPARIRFRKTGRQVVVHCGWVSPTVPEIDVLEVTKP